MKTATTAEELLHAQLLEAGYAVEREYKFFPHRRWRADFALLEHALLVEIEGVSYRGAGGRHQRGAGYQADCEKYNSAAIMGFHVLRFTPAMVRGTAKSARKSKPKIERAIDTIKRFVDVKRLAARNNL